jgi:hypothetical protein
MVSCILCLYPVPLCIRLLKLQTMGDSGTSRDVVLWGELATAFPAEQVHRDGKTTPQTVIFVGTLVKSFAGKTLLCYYVFFRVI